MQFSNFNWSVKLNKGDTHPVCVELSSGAMRLDLQVEWAHGLARFLANPCALPDSFVAGGGRWFDAVWDAKWSNGAHATISTNTAYATLPKHSAALLGDKIDRMIHELDGELKNKQDHPQPVDPLDGPTRRTDDNLRGVFG